MGRGHNTVMRMILSGKTNKRNKLPLILKSLGCSYFEQFFGLEYFRLGLRYFLQNTKRVVRVVMLLCGLQLNIFVMNLTI